MPYPYIAIEGNIGAGKTTLARLLAEHYNAHLVLEEFADNNFLPKFYQEPERYAFPLELSFLADRYKQLSALAALPDEKIIADYTITKNRLFAGINLNGSEYGLFKTLFDIIAANLRKPDLLIYLHTPVSKLQQHIAQRGRSYEQNIADDYLLKVEQAYQQLLETDKRKTIVIDTADVNFLNSKADLQALIEFLERDNDFDIYYWGK